MNILKKVILFVFVLVCGFLLFFFFTGRLTDKQMKTYSSKGFSIQLPSNFTESEFINATCYYVSKDAFVLASKVEFDALYEFGITKESSIYDYMETLVESSSADFSEIKSSKDGRYLYTTYEQDVSGKGVYYTAMAFKRSDAFWLCSFACDTKMKNEYKDKFHDWASTIVFE